MSIETLEAAIARLEELKSESTPGEWWTTRDLKWPGVFAGPGLSDDVLVANDFRLPGDAQLVVTLSRTVDPILSVLRGALEEWRDYEALAGGPVKNAIDYQSVIVAGAVNLARAILGEG